MRLLWNLFLRQRDGKVWPIIAGVAIIPDDSVDRRRRHSLRAWAWRSAAMPKSTPAPINRVMGMMASAAMIATLPSRLRRKRFQSDRMEQPGSGNRFATPRQSRVKVAGLRKRGHYPTNQRHKRPFSKGPYRGSHRTLMLFYLSDNVPFSSSQPLHAMGGGAWRTDFKLGLF